MLSLKKAIIELKKEKVLILPTDTLYGLGAIAYSNLAVKSVFDLKKRDYKKALPVHYYSIDLIKKDCIVTKEIESLVKQHWPGALTIILKKQKDSNLKFSQETVAVRIPNNKKLLYILKKLQVPLVMPSANITDSENIFEFSLIRKVFNIDGIKDDENIAKLPSTIISCLNNEIKVLRKGVVKI